MSGRKTVRMEHLEGKTLVGIESQIDRHLPAGKAKRMSSQQHKEKLSCGEHVVSSDGCPRRGCWVGQTQGS